MNMVMACFMVMAVAFPSLLNLKGATAEDYVVGDSLGWAVPPNTSFYFRMGCLKDYSIGLVTTTWAQHQKKNTITALTQGSCSAQE
ncbi:cucumber peeling cupredoxin-like [Prunus yedoensis var. nudiflora]|uniref:Cucumber peeling cupredoxin-like n=1 Tax=Prunus yedoensis var. nudiflora TaxID=2094558 RepID=A0A314YV19_PRUYE|nr:cucumber peeling cupredoxin-like [Prunus yedoensis var. nudiflora]